MKIRLRDKVLGNLLFYVLKLFTCLPRFVYGWLGFFVSEVLILVNFSPSSYFDENIFHVLGLKEGCPDYTEFKSKYLRHQVHCSIETLVGMMWPNKIQFDKSQHQTIKAIPVDKPIVLITGHIGAWELLSFSLDEFSSPLLLAKPTKYKFINFLLNKMRSTTGTRILWVQSDISAYRSILKALNSKEAVGFVFDQKSKNRQGPQVDFFEHPTDFVSGPALFAEKTGAVIGAVYCLRLGPFKYAVQSEYYDFSTKNSNVNMLTQFLASKFENKVKEYPVQWLWHYRKWTDFLK